MKSRLFRMLSAVLLAVMALTALAVTAVQARPATTATGLQPARGEAAVSNSLAAARRISIPFGINSTLNVSEDGHLVAVMGHGECPEGGEDFALQVRVAQRDNKARAMGKAPGDCASLARTGQWMVDATALGPHRFTADDAEVCAHVVIHLEDGGAATKRWCVQVTLE